MIFIKCGLIIIEIFTKSFGFRLSDIEFRDNSLTDLTFSSCDIRFRESWFSTFCVSSIDEVLACFFHTSIIAPFCEAGSLWIDSIACRSCNSRHSSEFQEIHILSKCGNLSAQTRYLYFECMDSLGFLRVVWRCTCREEYERNEKECEFHKWWINSW